MDTLKFIQIMNKSNNQWNADNNKINMTINETKIDMNDEDGI